MTSRKTPDRTARRGRQKAPTGGGPPARLNRDIQAKIGQHLREMHDDIVREGVPERFLALLSGLEAAKGREGK